MARAGPDIRRERQGQCGQPTPRGSVSAALGGGRNVLGRSLGELVRLQRADVLVKAMMAGMPDMMAAHPGVGVQHARLGLHLLGLDDGCPGPSIMAATLAAAR